MMSFRLARPDANIAAQFFEEILFGNNRKNAIMAPIPFGAG